jgi:hypothetical protein
MRSLIIVHGVNYFDEKKVLHDVTCQAREWGINAEEIEAFNWDKLMGHPDDPTPDSGLNTRFISELGAGILESAHIGFFERARNGQLPPRWFARLHSLFIFPLQLTSWLLVPALAVGFAIGHGVAVLCSLAGYMLWTTVLGILVGTTPTIRQCFRRTFMVATWGVASATMAPFVLPAATMVIVLLSQWAMFRWGRHWLEGHGLDTYRLYFVNFTPLMGAAFEIAFGSVAMACLVLLTHFLRQTPLGMLIKISADTCRYTGLAGYRSELLGRLDEKVRDAVAHQPTELVFLTHSLGSVIVTDYLLASGVAFANTDITLITMGSPLASLFPSFYPTEYCRPVETFRRINSLVRRFRWINYYRKYDPIGRKLGENGGPILDVKLQGPTQDAGRWTRLPAHADYWSHLNPLVASALLSQPMSVGDGSPQWQEFPPDIPVDNYRYGWNSHHLIAPTLWRMRRPFFGRFDKAKTRGRDILVWFVFISAALLAQAASLDKSVFAMRAIDYVSIIGISIFAFPLLWGVLQPYFNLAFACFPYFQPPTVRRQPLTWNVAKKPLALTALFLLVTLVYIAILVTPVSSWKKVGTTQLNDRPGSDQTLAAIDEHTLLIGRYPGVLLTDVSHPTLDPKELQLPWSTTVVSYNTTAQCAAAANSGSIAWGQRADFPRQIRALPHSALNGDVLSVGSDCRSMTIATDRALYFVDLTSTPLPKSDTMPISGFASAQYRSLFTLVVNPSGETTAFCGGDLWILRRDHSSIRVGTCSSYGRISFDERGKRVSWPEDESTIGIADTDSGGIEHVTIERRQDAGALAMISTALSPSGRFLAVGWPDEVRIYDLTTPSKPYMVAVYEGDRNLIGVSQVFFMASDQFVAVVDHSHDQVTVMRWAPHGIRERLMKALVHLKIRPDDTSLD